MFGPMQSSKSKTLASTLLVASLALGTSAVLVRAASLTAKYDAEVQRLRGEWRSAQAAEGLNDRAGRKALYGKYPTPEIGLCKPAVVAPGGTAKVTVPGKFQPNTAFVMENDQLQLTGGTVTATGYTATVTAAAGATPSFGRLYAYTPVSGAYNRCNAVMIGGAPSFELTAAKTGWTIKLAPRAAQFTVSGNDASILYQAEYFKPGEAKPFEVATGNLSISANDRPASQLTIHASTGGMGTALSQMTALQAEMADTKTFMKKSQKEQQALFAKLEALGEQMGKEQEAMLKDPAAAQKKQDEFGCGTIYVTLTAEGATGYVSCGREIGSLQFTGTRK